MTIIRCVYDGVIYDLDVLEEQPIRVDISAIENDAIGEVFGASSQQFTLPGSKKNNRFFKHAYKVGVTNVPGLGESVRASVITDSNVLLQGSLFLEEVVRTQIDGINYNVIIVNDVVSFNESVKTVAVKDLNWNAYTHSLSVENITGSWNNDLFSGSIFYPLIDQGRDGRETTGSLPNIAITETGSVGFINNSSTPLQVQQFTPAIQVKTVLDKIFEEGGFTYSSSLQPLFEQLYILPKQTENLSVNGSGFSDFGFIASKNSDQVIPAGGSYTKVTNPIEVYDPTNSYNTSTSVYTVPTSGTYSFVVNILWEIEPEDTSPAIEIRVRDTTNNSTLGTLYFSPFEITGSETFETSKVNLTQNSTIELQAAYDQGGGEGLLDIFILSGSSFRTKDTPINYETGIVEVGEQFDPQTKCIDILKGLIEKFNLVIEPVYTENKVLKIESYNNWIQSGQTKDWTQKVEKAKRIGLRHPLSSQPKTLIFEDNKDNDKLSKLVIDGADGYQWGTEIIDATSDVPQGERKVGSFFSPVVLEGIPGSANSLIPQLYKTDDTQQERKTFKFKPRLGYKVSGTLSTGSFIGSNADPFQSYATISNYDSLPITASLTKNLHYNDSLYPPTFTSSVETETAYKEYWNDYIVGLYQDDNRILNLDLEFTPEEIQEIALNDKIFVEDSIYRINKISGYNLVKPDVVGVELIKIEEAIEGVAPQPTPTPTPTPTTSPTPTPSSTGPTATPTNTPTGTPTPTATSVGPTSTPTPTPTSTPSFATFFINGDGTNGFNTNGEACTGGNTSFAIYTQAQYSNYTSWSAFNTRFYTDTALTTPFDGQGLYWGVNTTNLSSPERWVAIVGSGFLNSHNLCPTPTPTATPTPTPTPVPPTATVSPTPTETPTPTPTPQTLKAEIQQCGGFTVWYVEFTDLSSLPANFAVKSNHPNLIGNCWEIINPNYTGPLDFSTTTSEFPFSSCLSCLPTATPTPTPTTSPTATPTPSPSPTTVIPTATPTGTTVYQDVQVQDCRFPGGAFYGLRLIGVSGLVNDMAVTNIGGGPSPFTDPNIFWKVVDSAWTGFIDKQTVTQTVFPSCPAPTSTPTATATPTPTPTPTNTPTATPVPATATPTPTIAVANLQIYGKTLVSSFVSLKYSVNQGPTEDFFDGTLGSTCGFIGGIFNMEEGDIVTIFEDSVDFIAGNVGINNCPSTVGSSTAYNITLSAGTNNISLTINTGALPPTQSPTPTPTPTPVVWNSFSGFGYDILSGNRACTANFEGSGPPFTAYWTGAGVAFGDADILYSAPDGFSQVATGFYSNGTSWLLADANEGPPGSGVVARGSCPAPPTATPTPTASGTPTPTPTISPTQTPTPVVYSFGLAYSAVSEIDACGISTPNTTVYSTCGLLTTGCVLYTNSSLTNFAADGWYHNTSYSGYFEVEGNGTITGEGNCATPVPSPTPVPTSTPGVACTSIDMQTVGSSTSTGACNNGTSGSRRRHDGALPYPGIGDTIFSDINCSTTFDGGGLWYFVDNDTSAIQVGPTGIVMDKVIC